MCRIGRRRWRGTDDVKVEEAEYGYFSMDRAMIQLIFYPGAKVEDLAYASLLKQLAVDGIDCYLVHMPGNLAFMGMNRADKIMELTVIDHLVSGRAFSGRGDGSRLCR